MKIRYFSDLHLEFIKTNKLHSILRRIKSSSDEICVLAGDIGNPYTEIYDIFMKFINSNFKKSFVIAGNHEYYCNNITGTNNFLEKYFSTFDNISFLNNKYETYKDMCFIGTTLWSQITNPEYKINDMFKINNFNYVEYNKLNALCVDFLKTSLKNNKNAIVISHHMPHSCLIDNKYKTTKMLPYNQWFYCNMEDIFNNNIKCWIYGHTHTPSYKLINNIPFVCNPIGYPNENKNVSFDRLIDL